MKPFRSTLPLLLVAPALLPIVGAIASNPSVLRDPSERLASSESDADPLVAPALSRAGSAADPVKSPAQDAQPSDTIGSQLSASVAATRGDQLALEAGDGVGRRSIAPPPEPTSPSAVVRFGDTILKISQRYGLSIAELLRLNPGLDTARLVVGSQIQVARSSPGRSRLLLGLAPVGSGGLSWPETPQYGEGRRQFPVRSGVAYIWPAEGTFTSGYGWRWGRMHKGIDIANNVGTPVVAAARGQVTFAGWHSGGYGYLVEITHEDGTLTRYAHNTTLLVREGQVVEQGQAISRMGSTGRSTGPHLHFEVLPPGQGAMNPLLFLAPRA